jgi:hypothetical protein
MKQALFVALSAAVGAGLMWLFQGHSLEVLPSKMSYADFVAVLLTALSALVAILALIFAIFALWGWAQFRKGVEAKINEITPAFLAQELQMMALRDGGIPFRGSALRHCRVGAGFARPLA